MFRAAAVDAQLLRDVGFRGPLTIVSSMLFLRPKPRRLCQAVGIALLLAACGSNTTTDATSLQTQTTASDAPSTEVGLPTADGGQIDLNSLQGSDNVLWFWAPW